MPEAITAENLVELRKQADDVNVLHHALPDRRGTGGMTEEMVEALNAICDRYGGGVSMTATSPERVRVMVAWCSMLPVLGLVPLVHESDNAAWHWSDVRCLLAGAGYDAHAAIASALGMVYAQCPLIPSETREEWDAALATAHQTSGLPVCLAMVPWQAFKDLPSIADVDLAETNTRWLGGLALLHILKHVRLRGDEVRVMYRGQLLFALKDTSTNSFTDQVRVCTTVLKALNMSRMDGRSSDHDPRSVGTSAALARLTFDRLLRADPLTSAPGKLIVGAFTHAVPAPETEGWFQHGLQLTHAWAAHAGVTRGYEGTDDTILSLAWNAEALTPIQTDAYNRLSESIPATYTIDSPFDILRYYQPNIMLDWASDSDAHACVFDAIVIMSVMRDRVRGARREFPVVWVLPDDPTALASSNQGKTAAATALAGAMTPGILSSRPPDSSSAPDMRVIGGAIRREGTICLDEWAMPKAHAHPLSARSLQTLATGGAVPLGEVLENDPVPVMLRQPIVASSKCVSLPEDVRNRSFFLFMRTLTPAERSDVGRFEAIISGEVSMRMRLAAIDLVEMYQLDQLVPVASETFRFNAHVALAIRLLELRSGRAAPGPLQRIDAVMRAMTARYLAHVTASDDSGLATEMETGDVTALRASDIYANLSHAEATALYDVMMASDKGRLTAGQLLRARSAIDPANKSVRGLIQSLLGTTPKANDRALAQAFTRDLVRRMPTVGSVWPLPDMAGLDGWQLERSNDAAATPRFRLVFTHPAAAPAE